MNKLIDLLIIENDHVIEADSLVAYEWVAESIHWWVEWWEWIDYCIESIVEADLLKFASQDKDFTQF